MPRGRGRSTFRAMRWVPVLLVLCAVALFVRARASDDSAPSAAAQVQALPPQLRSLLTVGPDAATLLRTDGALPGLPAIQPGDPAAQPAVLPFADVGSRRELRVVRRDIRRDLAALNRLSDDDGATPAMAARTLAAVYSARVLAALGPRGRRAFATRVAGRTHIAQRVRVLGYDGIFVSGPRALAQVVYRLSMRAPSGRFLARAPETWTVTLARERGRWRFVRGLDSD
jgi:hypothetical protein